MVRPQREPHQLDNLSSDELVEAANGHNAPGWNEQRHGFVELRDLTGDLAETCERALSELRQSWSGGGAEAFANEFGKVIDLLTGLRDSAAVNADGMREISVVMNRVRDEIEPLRLEDKDWKDNVDGDDPETITHMREDIRKDLRDKLKDADGSYQHLAGAYLLPPPEPPRLCGMETIALGIDDTNRPTPSSETAPSATGSPESTASSPTLQNPHGQPTTAAPPVEPLPTATPPPAEPAPAAPMMPMSGMGGMGSMGGDPAGGASTGGRATSSGPTFGEARNVPPSRMRSEASRQELHNQSRYGTQRHDAPNEQRRAIHAEDDSPFAPTDATVVPPVITGGTPHDGPHDSGPTLTGTVYRHFPEYGHEEAPADLTEDYEDGSSAEITFDALDDEPQPIEPIIAPSDDATAREKTAEAAAEERLFNTQVTGDDYVRVLSELPADKAVEFADSQSKLRKPDPVVLPAEPPSTAHEDQKSGKTDTDDAGSALARLRNRAKQRREAADGE